MKNRPALKIVPIVFIFVVCNFFFTNFVQAVQPVGTSESGNLQVSATIGKFYLDLSGFIAPYASIVLTSNDIVLRSAVADPNGYFFISSVLIKEGFSSFCLDAIDYKRYGESYTCFTIPPAEASVEKKDIFLPPTLGLERKEINVGDQAVIRGFSMPNARVIVHINGKTYTVKARDDGYYELDLRITDPGNYQLFADATFQNQQSLTPNRKATLIALSVPQEIKKIGESFIQKLLRFLLGSPWGIVLIILPIIILIIILLRKLKPEWFTFIDKGIEIIINRIPFIPKKLHHAWFVGY